MIILGFDVGVKTGWAVLSGQRIVESGVQEFALSRGESPGLRFLRFRRWLVELLAKAVGPGEEGLIAFERAHHRGGHATEVQVGMTTRLEEIAAEQGMETLPVHSATLKKASTGSGRADKRAMMRRAEAIVGRTVLEDEADAILVALWAAVEVGER
jgi:Holliday junction resolvasome RuvABC endonuclease subunit